MVNSSNSENRKEPRPRLPRNVKLLGAASLLNDVASEMIYPLMPQFLMAVLRGNRFHLGIILVRAGELGVPTALLPLPPNALAQLTEDTSWWAIWPQRALAIRSRLGDPSEPLSHYPAVAGSPPTPAIGRNP